MSSGTHALSLQEATRNSTAAWQRDLAALFQHAKERFPDVVWELSTEGEEGGSGGTEEVWGHKAIVYARAPPSFQTRYFSFRPVDGLGASTMSLDIPRTSRSPSPLGRASPAPSTMGGITRLTTSINPTLFSNELEYLYTGQGFGEAFEFLFDEHAGEDSTSLDGEELRIDKLRKDLVFMWRSRLYSDVRVALTSNGPPPAADNESDDGHERQMPVFSSHRFVLASRSPYFHTALVAWPSPQKPLSTSTTDEPLTLSLPSPPFTPASLHFTLGFLYTGTLVFSHRTYDLSTALALLLSANYLQLPTLHAEVQARIIAEMAHGLFHAALPFAAYEELTKGAWRAGGCTCRKCAMRVPRILEFSLRPDVQDAVLERGARRALVGLFGTGWCTSEFAALPAKLQASALKGLAKRTTPANALAILWAAEAALARLSPMVDPWVDVVRPLIESGRSQVDAVLGNQTAEVLAEADFTQITHTAGVRFEDGERVEWAMRAVVRGVKETNAGRVYQALVNVLLLPHPDPPGGPGAQDAFPAQPLLAQTSHVRVQVEQARMDTLTWLKRGGRGRADRVAREGGLDGVEPWAVREIADHLELPLDDLLAAIPPAPGQHARQPTSTSAARKSTGLLSAHAKEADQHSLSIHTQQSSMRVSVLSRSIPTPRAARSVTRNGGLAASASSSAANSADEAHDEEEEHEEDEATAENEEIPLGDRPDSKLTPELGLGLGLGLRSVSDKGKGRANGNGHGDGSAPPSPTVAAMKKPPVPTRAVPVPPSPAPSSSSATSVGGSPAASRSTVSLNVTPPHARPRSAASSTRTGTASTRTGTASTRTSTARPGSVASQRSTSTVRTTRGGLKAPPLAASTSGGSGGGRRTSTASTSATTTDFHTAPSTASTRSRQSSVSSVVSRHSTATAGARSRKTSGASDVSVRTTGAGGAGSSTTRPPVPALDPALHSPGARRRGTPSIRSVASSTSTMDTAASAARKAAAAVTREKRNAAAETRPETKVITLKQRGRGTKDMQKTPTAEKDKEKEKAMPTPSVSVSVSEAEEDGEEEKGKDHRKTDSTTSSASVSTLRVKRKGSGDTVSTVTTKAGVGAPSSSTSTSTTRAAPKPKTTTASKRPAPAAPAPATGSLKDLPQPRGATLDIGIPCIISSKRKRFKAFARYIGEVEGESGPWVGVEVPPGAADNITFSSSSSAIGGGRQWHDGSWGGIRYFEIGPAGAGGSEAEYGYGDEAGRDRASRRRRLEGASGWSGSGTVKGVKREGDSSLLGGGARGAKRIRSASPAVSDADGAGEARGLFVRPSAVLYVVDAVGADI
ncbi:hypothetical protein C8R45DRAFT_1221533 [Mycena sanguinolenta]|nr:hypothetical protein C8R45DRAFT_1221533 [Mycena sanguinolenta]